MISYGIARGSLGPMAEIQHFLNNPSAEGFKRVVYFQLIDRGMGRQINVFEKEF
jgi:hypothetical protein